MNKALEVRGLCKEYPAFSLKGVSFDIPEGYIMGFIGPNGSGKTTTIKSILNIIHYNAGEVMLFGQNAKESNAEINERLGVVMDSPFYAEDWTAIDVGRAVSPFYSRWNAETYHALLKKFGIDGKKKVKELSRGMKVKLMISVALSHDAKLLILDEPTSGLDPVARDELCEMLSDFVTDEGHSVLFSTHITSDLEKIADYITFIMDGRIVYTGTKDDMLERYVSVKGGLGEIDAEAKKHIIGLREHGTGFDGMADVSAIGRLPKNLLIEPITLEEIIIYMNKGAKLHE